MGKGNRVRTERADERQAKKEAIKKKEKKQRLSHNITIAVSIVLVIAIVAGLAYMAFKGTIDSRRLHNTVSVTSENYQLNNAEMTYFFNYNYLYFLNQYSSYLSYVQLDTSTDLKRQNCGMKQQDGYTWYDYFIDSTKDSTSELLVLCEEAKARGIELDENDRKDIEHSIEDIKEAASSEKLSLKEYIKKYYGSYVTEEDIRHCAELQKLASKCYNDIYNEPEYTDEKITQSCADNLAKYYFCDYKVYTFAADYEEGADEATVLAAQEKAAKNAENMLSAATSEEEFDRFAEEFYRDNYTIIADDDTTTEQGTYTMTETELQTKLDNMLTEGSAYTVDTDFGKWAFEQNEDGEYVRKVGDTVIIPSEDDDTYAVYYLIKTMYRHEYNTKNVRHILITVDSYDTEAGLPTDEAKAKAEEILNEFQAGDATEESFAALAEQHSMDQGSSDNGGLYENVLQGKMVTEFDSWIYDEARTAGETAIVSTQYGYHVMYFVGDGQIAWKTETEANLRSEDYSTAYTALTEKYTVNYEDKKLQNLTPIKP